MRVSPSSRATLAFLGLIVGGAACGSLATSSAGAGAATTAPGGSAGGSAATSSDACTSVDAGIGGGFPFPVVSYSGGLLVTAPRVVTVTFTGDAMAAELTQMGDALASSTYWNEIRPGFFGAGDSTCVGDGPRGTSVVLGASPAASYTDSDVPGGASTLKTWLSGLITDHTLPAPDANTIYALYFPPTTSISFAGGQSCQDFDGYHEALTVGSQTVIYAVIPECAAPVMTPEITTLQNTTITTSHEVIESATDAVVTPTTGGYYLDFNDEDVLGWNDVLGGEVADLCVDVFGLGQDETSDGTFTVQRIWSIPRATAGKNPCVPIPAGEVYFNVWPSATVLVMDVGESRTVTLQALADGAMPAWMVLAEDFTDATAGTTYLTFSIAGGATDDAGTAETTMASGDTAQLTVTLVADPGQTPNGEADGAVVSANNTDAAKVTAAHFWPFIALTPAEAALEGLTMERRRSARPHRLAHARGRHPLFNLAR